jgi:glycosyltransferase involved in cell wall biosynthesis
MKPMGSPVNLVIYSHSFWPAVGGVETYARLLAEGIAEDGAFRTAVVTQTPNTITDPGWKFHIVRGPGIGRLWQLIRAADVVLIAGPALLPMALAVLANKPFIVEHHGYQAICPNGLLLNKYRGGVCAEAFRNKRYGECRRCVRADRGSVRAFAQLALTFVRHRLCRRAYAHVAVSDHVRKRHDLEGMKVIYHGIPDRASFAGSEAVDHGGGEVHFGYVGRFVEEKGLPLLVEAAGKLKAKGIRHQLSFIGDGPLRVSLQAQAEAAGLNGDVRFTGFLEGAALQRAIADVDVVVMPSVWEETAGLSAMEQMMRGRVVLAADIGGLGEIVGDGGVKFRPFDAEDLAKKMVDLTRLEFRSTVGKAARERAARLFRLERMVTEHKTLFSEACRLRGRRKQDAS